MATLIAPEDASPVADAEALKKACQGWGTNEKAIVSILGHRNATQRQLIRHAFEDLYHEDLVKRLESELSGDFEKAVYRWILDPHDRDAVLLHVAIRKKEVLDYRVIVEISCTHVPEELLAVKRAYLKRYNHSVEEDIADHAFGDLRKLLVALVSVYRYAGGEINARLAKSEADTLRKAIEEKKFNEDEVLRIVTTRSKAQLMATFNRYKDKHDCSITKHLLDDPADAYLDALRIAIKCIVDHQKYFEKVLRNAINRRGTDEDALSRVLVTRAEKDLLQIKELYYKRNSVSLDHAVAKETSGDYKDLLLCLLGKDI